MLSWSAPWWVLWVVLACILGFLLLRTLRKDRREYRRFKRYRTTQRRQAMYAKWLRESFATFGGVAAVGLALAGSHVAPFLDAAQEWPWVAVSRTWMSEHPAIVGGIVIGVVLGLVAITVAGIVSARRHPDELVALGDIRALLPRNRDELSWGAALSVNAGIVEELAFRLAIPAVLYGASGNAVLAVAVSVVLFGVLHAYQGVTGVIGATLIGAVMMALFVVSGTILLPVLLHAVIDLRSLVLIPAAVLGVHRTPGAPIRSATRTS